MKDYAAKILSLFILLALTVLFGLIPCKLFPGGSNRYRGGRYRRAGVSLASCFAGGIFFGTCLLHLLPEVREKYQYVFCRNRNIAGYPLAEFTVACGFFVVLIFEQVILIFHKPRKRSQCSTGDVPPHGCDRPPPCRNCATDEEQNPVENTPSQGRTAARVLEHVELSQQNTDAKANGTVVINAEPVNIDDTASLTSTSNSEDVEVTLVMQEGGRMASIRALLLLAALSLHSLFEGLALGLQNSSSDVFEVFAAVALHKSLLSFSLGVRLIKAKSSVSRVARAVFILALMSPVGVVIGIAVSSAGGNNINRETATAVLEGIATGTFLFVTFFEILTNELKDRASSDIQIAKVFLAVLGFAAVAAMKINSNDRDNGVKACSMLIKFRP